MKHSLINDTKRAITFSGFQWKNKGPKTTENICESYFTVSYQQTKTQYFLNKEHSFFDEYEYWATKKCCCIYICKIIT